MSPNIGSANANKKITLVQLWDFDHTPRKFSNIPETFDTYFFIQSTDTADWPVVAHKEMKRVEGTLRGARSDVGEGGY